ncbi:hypothetical protein PQC39_gp009 [Vibrio phage Vp_R1]|uniref:Uncharacterized protein n=1 Tax=Vibrio phage Vp_R1 TaxID=2059867 RepID=A0A2H5BPW3_9CAUD|nr:hypothetical protein PQC39_gp009 [Vibrio phage Vp_R1]AUG88373.1 hypothetical protein VPR_009 [Vibrio phage Vp_R1]
MNIFCCECGTEVVARLTNGKEVYPHREDLFNLPFWKCDCGNFVGCHYKTDNPTKPLGCIPNPEIKKARGHIHALLDPIWESGKITRTGLYKRLSDKLGYKYHTAEIKCIVEARRVYSEIRKIKIEILKEK